MEIDLFDSDIDAFGSDLDFHVDDKRGYRLVEVSGYS